MRKNYWEHLQPLRIPGGWTVVLNKLENLEPEELAEQDKRWLFSFTEDILYMYTILSRKRNGRIEQQKLAIDLGFGTLQLAVIPFGKLKKQLYLGL